MDERGKLLLSGIRANQQEANDYLTTFISTAYLHAGQEVPDALNKALNALSAARQTVMLLQQHEAMRAASRTA